MGRLMTVVAMALVLLGLCAEAVEGTDLPGFVDEQGRGCSDWANYDCHTAVGEFQYTTPGQAALFENCPATCDKAAVLNPTIRSLGFTACYTAFLTDQYADGWNGNYLTITNEVTGDIVGSLTQLCQGSNDCQGSGGNYDETEEFMLCLPGCGASYTGIVAGDSYFAETSWRLETAGGVVIAEAEVGNGTTFTVGTVCGANEYSSTD